MKMRLVVQNKYIRYLHSAVIILTFAVVLTHLNGVNTG